MLVGFRTSVLSRPTEITASMTSKLWLLNLGCIMLHFFFSNYFLCAQPFFPFKRSQVLNSLLETQNNLIYMEFSPYHFHILFRWVFSNHCQLKVLKTQFFHAKSAKLTPFSNQFCFFYFLECDTFFYFVDVGGSTRGDIFSKNNTSFSLWEYRFFPRHSLNQTKLHSSPSLVATTIRLKQVTQTFKSVPIISS